jgi:hypothetical protein
MANMTIILKAVYRHSVMANKIPNVILYRNKKILKIDLEE